MGTLAIRPNSRRAYALALALLVAALAAQWALRPLVGGQVPFLFFLPAIGIAAMWAGSGPALVTLAGGVANAFFWMGTGGGLSLSQAGGQVALGGYVIAGALLAALGGYIGGLRMRAAAAERDLAQQVRDLQGLHELHDRIALLPELQQQLQVVLETACRLQAADRGRLAVEADAERPEAVVVTCGPDATAFAADAPGVYAWPLLRRSGTGFGSLLLHLPVARSLTMRELRLAELCAGVAAVLCERDEALRHALASSRRLEVALDTSAVPFCLLSPVRGEAGQVTGFRWDYVNAAAAKALRRTPAEVSGRPVRATLVEGLQLEPGLLARMVDALRSQATVRFETWVEVSARRLWFDVIASPYEGGLAVWFSDVTTRKQHEEALREADRRKDEFLATLAHELRNPLAPVRQAALIARSPQASEEKKHWASGVIERQVGHMAMLLDDLLDVSRITRGKLELRRAPAALADIVEAALEPARPLLEERRQELRTELPAAPVWLDADRLRLAQVLSNLLTNASKYTPEGGRVTLAAHLEDGAAVIEVRDNGAGIPPESLDRIFEMFTQVRTPDGGRAGGLGIGLALSRGLVELHGGRLTAHSAGLGQGSTFTVRLPVAQPAHPPVAQREDARAAPARRRVLVADDNRDAAQSLADLLRMEGHEVALAFDGAEALDVFRDFRPDAALLDIGMPRLTGNEVAQAIRAQPGGAEVLLVAITGWGQERDREAARGAGFDVHFTKPVDPLQVLGLLARQDGSARPGAGSPGAVLPAA